MPKKNKTPTLNYPLAFKLYRLDVRKYVRYLVRHKLNYSQRGELLDRLISMEFRLLGDCYPL